MIRFRSFRATLLTLFLVAVATTQIATYFIVAEINTREAKREITTNLRTAAVVFERITRQRIDLLATSATAVASDYAFRQSFFALEDDPQTIATVFESASSRIGGDLNAWVDLDGFTITSSPAVSEEFFAELVFRADESEAAQAIGETEIDGQLYSVIAVPIRAPLITAWWVIGFRVDEGFAEDLRALTNVEVSFANSSGQVVASSLPAETQADLEMLWGGLEANDTSVHEVELAGEACLIILHTAPLESGGELTISLQYSLDEKLAPARRLARLILLITAGGLVMACLFGLGFARRLSQPVQALAAHTQIIAAGDYQARLDLDRSDELGDLARSFNAMSTGLAERDQVRDLLDKNVSPEVAAELMREGAALGGEEREVTILFADLRGFTTLSEKLPPRDVVALLNRYLDRMSEAIEAAGGVIDKFIGDEIMALFGAPVPGDDAADRALSAALEMRRELVALNQVLAAEGKPPLAFGIGINTGRVIAGNIGSQRRLNYSVIGDGVNIAARLQTLTRQPDFATDLIISDCTRRALRGTYSTRELGEVVVKGRVEPLLIHAVDVAPESS